MPTTQQAAPAITPEILREHGINAEEYQKILTHLGRVPTMTELGIFSVMWSEHCSYKSSRVHLKRLPTRSKLVVQGPGENAGIIDIGDGWVCAFKIESHNHPSYIEPFQGAATGVGGILRDIFTMGARPLAVMDSLRFGPLARGKATTSDNEEIHKNHSVVEGVVHGIASYGNCFGVPNLGGETRFEDCYSNNPLVNAFALGLAKKDEIFYARAAGEGNPVIYVGAKTGRDGIHGATMASEEFTEGSEQKRPNVQVGDPFLEKLLLEACLEAMHSGAVVGIQDMGAAGLTCSTCEMGARGGVGLEIELDNVPQRESGMNSYEIMLSESQERMLLVAEKGREQEVLKIFAKWGLDAVVIGKVINESTMRVRQHGQIVAEIPNQALTDDAPLYHRPVGTWTPKYPREVPSLIKFNAKSDYTSDLKAMLASPNICSKRWVHEQYESMVQTNTVVGPGASDAGVMRIKGTDRGLAMALDCNGRWCYLEPRLGAMHAVAEAARKVAMAGGKPVATTNCLNFGNPEKPEIMAQFSAVVDGMSEACTVLETPITGGNVSFYNETLGEGIYPTPTIGIVGLVEDIHKVVTANFQRAGDALLVLHKGGCSHTPQEFGSSEYAKEMMGAIWGMPPALDINLEAKLQQCVLELIQKGLITAAHDVSDGGIAVALAEMAFAREVGVKAEFASDEWPAEMGLFAEHASHIFVTCDQSKVKDIQSIAVRYGLKADPRGATQAEKFEISYNGKVVVSAKVSELKQVWSGSLEKALNG